MVEIGSQKMQNVALPDRRSLGSNQYSSGRFPKVSIGIMVDQKIGSKEDAAALPAVGRISSCPATQKTTRTELSATMERKQSEAVNQKAALFSTKSVQLETPTAQTVQFYVNRASVLHSEGGLHKTLDAVAYGRRRQKGGDVERVEEVAYASVQETSFLEKGVGREQPEKIAGRSTESLKVKLWEVLGTAPSQNRHNLDSPNLEKNKEDIDKDQNWKTSKDKVAGSNINQPNPQENRGNGSIDRSRGNQKSRIVRTKSKSSNLEESKENTNTNRSPKHQKGKVPKPKQDSDTIENDTESTKKTPRRPLTRSLTRKKAPPKTTNKNQGFINCGKKQSPSTSAFKLKLDKNIFAFDEGERIAGTLNRTASGNSSRSKNKINEHMKGKFEPRRIFFDRSASDNSLHSNNREQALLSPNKNSPYCKEKEKSPCMSSHIKKQLLQRKDCHNPQKEVQNHFSSPQVSYNAEPFGNTVSPLYKRKKFTWDYEVSPSLPKNDISHKKDNSPMLREPDQMEDLQSPTFAMNSGPTPTTMPPDEVLCNGQPRNLSPKVHGSKDLPNSTSGSCQSDTNTESTVSFTCLSFQDATPSMHMSQDMETPHTEDEETDKQLPLSPMKEQNIESKADYCKGKDSARVDEWFSHGKSPNNSPSLCQQTVKAYGLNELRKSNSSSLSQFGTFRAAETVGSFEVLEQLPEDSLARSIAQLALVLQKFRADLKIKTCQQSSEVLMAAADKIRLQLQDVESHIVADIGKFASIGKSKRKHFELELQEQQERLRLIHDKFKDETNQHLMDCRRTLEKLEVYDVELKGTADRQKASHRKLLLQFEEAMEAQISDAEARIAAIHKEARKKMNGLKCLLRECV